MVSQGWFEHVDERVPRERVAGDELLGQGGHAVGTAIGGARGTLRKVPVVEEQQAGDEETNQRQSGQLEPNKQSEQQSE